LVTSDLPAGTGTVTDVTATGNNGVSVSVATATTTPSLTIGLGAITPTSISTGTATVTELINTTGQINPFNATLSTGTKPLESVKYRSAITSALTAASTNIMTVPSGTM
jgi:hypothetical protein